MGELHEPSDDLLAEMVAPYLRAQPKLVRNSVDSVRACASNAAPSKTNFLWHRPPPAPKNSIQWDPLAMGV
jgi:hypothetical protein